MNIFDYFFQKGHFKGSLKKRAHQQKNFGMGAVWGGGGADNPPTHPAPEGLLLSNFIFL